MIVKNIGITQLQSDALALRLAREIHGQQQVAQGKLYHQAQNAAACARQAVAYRQAENGLDLTVMPLFRYYSLLNTLKALLYLFDLNFPKSTSILQHGISVRRTKRASYQWTWEAVTLHKDGIAQSFAGLRDNRAVLPARVITGDLLGQFPQMTSTIHLFDKHFIHAYPLTGDNAGSRLVSRDIASNQGLTIAEWRRSYIDAAEPQADSSSTTTDMPNEEPAGLMRIAVPSRTHPWLNHYEGISYLRDDHPFPLWLAHYGLLYTLSALCRYSPSEWSDIVLWHSEPDALLVREYFKIPPLQLYLNEVDGWSPATAIRYGSHQP